MTDHGDDLIRVIGALAFDIHMNRSGELSCDLPITADDSYLQTETPDYRIGGNTVHFISVEARNRVVAAYMFEEKCGVLTHDDPEWLGIAQKLWRNEVGKSDSSAGRFLALVHNVSDIFTIATNAIESKSVPVFDVLRVIESALPYLNELPSDGVLKLIAAQQVVPNGGQASGMLFNRLEEKLAGLPDTCRAIHNCLRNESTEATMNLYSTALFALVKSYPEEALGLVLEDVKSPYSAMKNAAFWTLGRFLALSLVTKGSLPIVSATIIENISNPSEDVRRAAINAAACAAHVTDAFDDYLIKLGASGDQYTLCVIANAIYMNIFKMRSKKNFSTWLQLLCKLSPANGSIVHQLDFVLSQLISEGSQQQLAISCLSEWLSINADDVPRDRSIAELFNTTSHELANRTPLLSQVITDWFLADNRKLASAAAGLLSHLWVSGYRNPEFSASRLDTLEPSDLMFLARRMLGFLFSEDHLLSLTMSFLKTKEAPKRTYGIVRSLFVDELGQDFPSSTIDALESANVSTNETELKVLYSSAITAINHRITTLNSLPRLDELRPPPRLQREFAKARNKQMQESMEEAQKGSILRQICTEIPVKAGIGFFSFRDGAYSDATQMKSISHSVSVPMREALDAVGYNMSRFMMRMVKREKS